MANRVPRESYVIGYPNPNGTLHLYALRTDPERFTSIDEAYIEAERLSLEHASSRVQFKVYRMRFEDPPEIPHPTIDPILEVEATGVGAIDEQLPQ